MDRVIDVVHKVNVSALALLNGRSDSNRWFVGANISVPINVHQNRGDDGELHWLVVIVASHPVLDDVANES